MPDRTIELMFTAKDVASSVMEGIYNSQKRYNDEALRSAGVFADTKSQAESFRETMKALDAEVQQGYIGWGEYATRVNQAKAAMQNQAAGAAWRSMEQNNPNAVFGAGMTIAELDRIGAKGPGKAAAAGGGMSQALGIGAVSNKFMGLVTAGAALEFVFHGMKKVAEEEMQEARLRAVAKAGGNLGGLGAEEIINFAHRRADETLFKRGDIEQSASVLGTYHNLGGDQFKEAMVAAQDLAAVMGTDVVSSARLLGRALEDPEQGMQGLRRAGIVLSESTKEAMKSAFDYGDATRAQAILLEEIHKRFGGVATEMANTAEGSFDRLGKAFDRVQKNVSSVFIPLLEKLANITAPGVSGKADEENDTLRKKIHDLPGNATESQISAVMKEVSKAQGDTAQRMLEIGKHQDGISWLNPLRGYEVAHDALKSNYEESHLKDLDKMQGSLGMRLGREKRSGDGAKDQAFNQSIQELLFGPGGFDAFVAEQRGLKDYDKKHPDAYEHAIAHGTEREEREKQEAQRKADQKKEQEERAAQQQQDKADEIKKRYVENARTPEERRMDDYKQLASMSDKLNPQERKFEVGHIENEYRQRLKEKDREEGGPTKREHAMQGFHETESSHLTRGAGSISPAIQEAQTTNKNLVNVQKAIEDGNKLLQQMIDAQKGADGDPSYSIESADIQYV